VHNRATATLPEDLLVQFLADPIGLQRVFAGILRPEDRQRTADQIVAREDAAQADNPLVDQHDIRVWTQSFGRSSLRMLFLCTIGDK
jgi:hypothetical protein